MTNSGNQPSRSLLCDIMMYKNKDISTIPAIQWGLKHEATALSAYLKKFEETHRTVEVVRPGLVTNREYPYIRALPDAIISCNCHGYNIIEIKCPYKARCMEPKQAVLESKIDYVKIGINGTLELVCAHKYGYYEQVMTQLACSEQKSATLIIWTKLGFIDLPIQFDEQYWCKSMLPKLKQFFETIVVTEILTGHMKKQLDSNISENADTVTNIDETTEEKKEDLDDSLSNSSSGK